MIAYGGPWFPEKWRPPALQLLMPEDKCQHSNCNQIADPSSNWTLRCATHWISLLMAPWRLLVLLELHLNLPRIWDVWDPDFHMAAFLWKLANGVQWNLNMSPKLIHPSPALHTFLVGARTQQTSWRLARQRCLLHARMYYIHLWRVG